MVRCALRELDELEMTGGVLTAGGKIYGFAVASMINETMMDENIEKADGEEPGAYPMVCREMAKMMKQKYPGLVFINREEDTGDEGCGAAGILLPGDAAGEICNPRGKMSRKGAAMPHVTYAPAGKRICPA
ncbi:MAG: hypothetical protein ACLTY5_05995 [Angelakisella sp.]